MLRLDPCLVDSIEVAQARPGRGHDELGRALEREPVGVDHQVVVGGVLGGDAVEALDAVGPVGVGLPYCARRLSLVEAEGASHAGGAGGGRGGDEHPQHVIVSCQRWRRRVGHDHRSACRGCVLDDRLDEPSWRASRGGGLTVHPAELMGVLLQVTDFNHADEVFRDTHSSECGAISSALQAVTLHLKGSDQAGIVGTPIWDAVGNNAAIKEELVAQGWQPNIPIPAPYAFLGKDVDFVKSGVVVEVQFSNYPFLLNNPADRPSPEQRLRCASSARGPLRVLRQQSARRVDHLQRSALLADRQHTENGHGAHSERAKSSGSRNHHDHLIYGKSVSRAGARVSTDFVRFLLVPLEPTVVVAIRARSSASISPV